MVHRVNLGFDFVEFKEVLGEQYRSPLDYAIQKIISNSWPRNRREDKVGLIEVIARATLEFPLGHMDVVKTMEQSLGYLESHTDAVSHAPFEQRQSAILHGPAGDVLAASRALNIISTNYAEERCCGRDRSGAFVM